MATRPERLPAEQRDELLALIRSLEGPASSNPGESTRRMHEMLLLADSYDPIEAGNEVLVFSPPVYRHAWKHAAELRRSGDLLRMGPRITCPVTAVHGDYDPHPARGASEPLARVLKDFRFILLDTAAPIPGWSGRRRRSFSPV